MPKLTICRMKIRDISLFVFLSLFSMLLLSSCYINHARVYEQAIEYEGIIVEEPMVHYKHEGKPYRRGTRVSVQLTRNRSWMSFKETIVGPSAWDPTKRPGSESAILCRELVRGKNGMEYHPDSQWQEPSFPMTYGHKDPVGSKSQPVLITDYDSRHLTWRGIYAVPAAAVLLVVETPFNLLSSVYHLIKYL